MSRPGLPPGPRSGLFNLLRYFRDPCGSTLRSFARYGDPYTAPLAGTPMVMTGDPALVKSILAAEPEQFDAFGKDLLGPVMGLESLMMLDGARHRAARKLLSPPFNGARMREYAEVMRAAAVGEASRWPAGVPFSMQRATQVISLRVILRAVLGVTDPAESAVWERLLVDLLAALGPAVMFVPALRRELGGLGPWARLQRRIARVERAVFDELARRRADGRERNDILSLILAARYDDGAPMTDRQVLETLMTLVAAGHETSALAIAWALWQIHRHGDVHERLSAELAGAGDEPEAWSRLPYLGAVCQEALRLHPVAPSFVRLLARPFTLGDWKLPAGVAVAGSIIRLHQREDLYPEPERFRPERFLERSFAPWELIPFGGGHRRCIGAAFALFEMKVVVAALLRARPLRLVSHAAVGLVPRNTVLGPRRPLRFIAGEPATAG